MTIIEKIKEAALWISVVYFYVTLAVAARYIIPKIAEHYNL